QVGFSYDSDLKHYSFDTKYLRPFNAKFNETDSYLLWSRETENLGPSRLAQKLGANSTTRKRTLELHCVGCGLVVASGSPFDLSDVRTVDQGPEAGLHFETRPFELMSKPIPRAGVEIKKLLKLGTFFVVTALVELDITLAGAVSFGYVCKWGPVGAMLDLKNDDQSMAFGDWSLENKCERQAAASASLSVTLTPSFTFALRITVELLGKFTNSLTAGVSLAEKISLPLTAELTTVSCPNKTGAAIKLSSTIKDELFVIVDLGTYSKPFSLGNLTEPFEINSTCIPGTMTPPQAQDPCDAAIRLSRLTGNFTAMRQSLGTYGSPNNSASTTNELLLDPAHSPEMYLTAITGGGFRFQRDICNPGDLRVADTPDIDDFEWVADEDLTMIGTFDHRVVYTPASTLTNGIGKPSLALIADVPPGSKILVLALTLLDRNHPNYDDDFHFYDSDLNVYNIAICSEYGGERKLYLFTDSTKESALQSLANNTFNVAGDAVVECEEVRFEESVNKKLQVTGL
ncbi:hypothetical protein B0H14DRAFT_2647745, partial [Mycena olivaceomarginata]